MNSCEGHPSVMTKTTFGRFEWEFRNVYSKYICEKPLTIGDRRTTQNTNLNILLVQRRKKIIKIKITHVQTQVIQIRKRMNTRLGMGTYPNLYSFAKYPHVLMRISKGSMRSPTRTMWDVSFFSKPHRQQSILLTSSGGFSASVQIARFCSMTSTLNDQVDATNTQLAMIHSLGNMCGGENKGAHHGKPLHVFFVIFLHSVAGRHQFAISVRFNVQHGLNQLVH